MLSPPDSIFSQVQYFDPRSDIENEARNLPHWRQTGRTYFVTFRLGDSLPADKLRELQIERAQFIESHPQPWTGEVRGIHRKLGLEGALWQHEGYDHIVRSPEALRGIARYIVLNPKYAHFETEFVFSRVPNSHE